ncbi:MAG TPA: hypothetical protein VF533_21395 [Solirubrobacteraceae bacterium]
MDHPSGRSYFKAYRVRREAERAFLIRAVECSGGRVVADSGGSRAPIYFAIQEPDGALTAALIYPFSAGHDEIRNRPDDEHRLQIKYGDITETWRRQHHPLGFDPMGIDVTLVLAVHADADRLIGLDPLAYDPLPMGIQVGFKASDVRAAQRTGWHAWERENRPGRRRGHPRVEGVETIVAFAPERLLDYIAFERHAQTMRLDSALRLRAAEAAATSRATVDVHDLEASYGLSALEVLQIVSERTRLAVAVRGGVAEHHLGRTLAADPAVATVEPGKADGPPDFVVALANHPTTTVECKNASPKPYADGTPKVEVQKTRASRGDPLSRLYATDAFDVLAVCMYGPTGKWSFCFRRADQLARHPEHPDRIAPMQRVDGSWEPTLSRALAA